MIDAWVYQCTDAHRQLVDAMSYPGKITSLKRHYGQHPYRKQICDAFALIAKTLLDTEVSFASVGQSAVTMSAAIQRLTGSPQAPLEQADYIFIDSDVDDARLAQAVHSAKCGDLVDPHLSATLIVKVKQITNTEYYRLTGPGIKDKRGLSIDGIAQLLVARNQIIKAYPLGIELIFVDEAGNVVAIPRTTQLEEV